MFSKKYGFYRKSVEDIRKLTEIMSDNNINIDIQYYKRRNIAITIAAILLPAVCVAVQAISYFSLSLSTQNYVHNYTSYQPSVTSPFEDTLAARVVLFVPFIVLNFPFAIPACFLMLISVLLLTIFNAFNKHIDHITKEDQTSFIINVDTLRSIHVKMCGITCDLDKDVRYFYGNIFLWIMLIGIVVLYILVKSTLQYLVVLILLYYFALTTTTLAAVTISASLVHVAAHASLDTIYNIDVKNANFDQAIQLNLFLSKLTGTQVGFTTCGLFTITKEFILTIAGVFLTYFAVLYTL